MTPSHSRGANGKAYRYYVSPPSSDAEVRRIAAPAIEAMVRQRLSRLSSNSSDPTELAIRIALGHDEIRIQLPARLERTVKRGLLPDEEVSAVDGNLDHIRLTVPARFAVRNGGTRIRGASVAPHRRDDVLVRALRAAHAMVSMTRSGSPAVETVPGPRYLRRLVRLAFLSPSIQRAILAGEQPASLRLEDLIRNSMPLGWADQQKWVDRLAR